MKLLPRESINSKRSEVRFSSFNVVTDQGILRVDVLAGKDLRAADKTGELYRVYVFTGADAFPRQI